MLFFKECKKVICSLTFLLYIVVMVGMYATQFVNEREPIARPIPGETDYDITVEENPEVIMPSAVEALLEEYLRGYYVSYPIMFYKEVRLKEAERLEMRELLEELTGLSAQELDGFEDYQGEGYYAEGSDEQGNPLFFYQEAVVPEYTLPKELTYERFCKLMQRADDLIGGGTNYSSKNLVASFGKVPMNEEQAMEEYQKLMEPEELGKAYLRLCCDYVGIELAVCPVFVAVAMWQQDKKAGMQDLIYTRKSSALRIVGTRYLALICCMSIPLLAVLGHAMIEVSAMYPDTNIAWGGALGISLLWLLPNILIGTAIGMLLTEALSPLLAIFIQGAWWFISLNMTGLTGGIRRFELVLRHNSVKKVAIWESQWNIFVENRLLFTALAVVCLGITIWLYERKRRGGLTWWGGVFGGRRAVQERGAGAENSRYSGKGKKKDAE